MTDQQNPYSHGQPTPAGWQEQGTPYGPQPMPGQPSNQNIWPTTAPGPWAPEGGPYPGPEGEPPLNQPYYSCPFTQAISRFFRNYAVFTGRASRSEYWWPVLGYSVVTLLIEAFGKATRHDMDWLSSLLSLAVLLPFIAVTVRRLHDSNRSGWWAALPIGLLATSMVFALVFAAQFAFGLGPALSGSQDNTLLTTGRITTFAMMIWMLLMLGCLFAFLIVTIVFMTSRPDPRGARFDDNALPPVMPPYSPMGYSPNGFPNGYPYDPTDPSYANPPQTPDSKDHQEQRSTPRS